MDVSEEWQNVSKQTINERTYAPLTSTNLISNPGGEIAAYLSRVENSWKFGESLASQSVARYVVPYSSPWTIGYAYSPPQNSWKIFRPLALQKVSKESVSYLCIENMLCSRKKLYILCRSHGPYRKSRPIYKQGCVNWNVTLNCLFFYYLTYFSFVCIGLCLRY